MPHYPVCRRQFLGSAAAAAAVGPSAALGPAPVPPLRPLPLPVAFAPEELPAGVARQFGSARFRIGGVARARFSADARWLLWVDETECVGYEVPTARRVQFPVMQEEGWAVEHWVATTDGRLMVVERNGNEFAHTRLRWYDLPAGRPHPPVSFDGRVRGVSADGSVALIERLGQDLCCRGVHIRSKQVVWEQSAELLLFPLDPTGRFATGSAFVRDGVFDNHPTLIHISTGRRVKLTPTADDHFITVELWPACVSADGSRLMAGVKKADKNWPDRRVVWDTTSGKVVGVVMKRETEKPYDDTLPIGLSADGRGWYGVDGDARQLVLREVASGELLRRLPVFDVDETASAVAPDGKTLFVGRTERGLLPTGTPDNRLIRLIDADTGATLPQSPDPPGPLVRVWFPTAGAVAAAYRPRAGHLDYVAWDVATGRGRRAADPTDRNEPARATDPDPIPLVSPDLAHTLRLQAGRLVVLHAASGRAVASCEPPSAANSRWFWLTPGTVGVFCPAGLVLWEWATGVTRTISLALPGKWPHVWRWRASADATTVTIQLLPHLSERLCRVGWVDVKAGTLALSEASAPGSGEGFAVSADGRRAVVLLGKRAVYMFDRAGTGGVFHTDPVHKGFDLTGCGRTLAVQCYRQMDDTGQCVSPSLQLWETASGERRHSYPLTASVADLRASACGRFVATVRADQPVYLWDVYGEKSDPQPEPTAADFARLWADLAGEAGVAFRAIRTLVQHPRAAVRLLDPRLKPAVAPPTAWLDERIARLSDPDFRVRQTAERELTGVADVAAEQLRTAAEAGVESAEAEERLTRVLGRATAPHDWLRTTRAVEVLEYGGAACGPLLARLSNGSPGLLTREAAAARERMQAGG